MPAGIKNAPVINSMSMMFPMIMYWITHEDRWLKKCMLPMAVTEENITDDIYETAKLSISYSKVKVGMPGNAAHCRANHSKCHYLFTGGKRAYEQSDGRGETNDYRVFKTRMR